MPPPLPSSAAATTTTSTSAALRPNPRSPTSTPSSPSYSSTSSSIIAVYRRRRFLSDLDTDPVPEPHSKRPRRSPPSAPAAYPFPSPPKRTAAAIAAARISAVAALYSRRRHGASRAIVTSAVAGGRGIKARDANAGGPIAAASPFKKRPPRSGEMVRANCASRADQLSLRALVRRARITYESLRLLIVLRGDAVCPSPPNPLRPSWVRRPDLKAAEMMGDRGLWLNREHRLVGPVPGVEIGDVFFYRMELVVVGLHGRTQGGIDFVPASKTQTGEPIATSIVVSGGYEDDEDRGNELIYTGQGGRERNRVGVSQDQKLESGNLALERSLEYGIEVRVIRGSNCQCSPSGKIYVYDGLYKVVDYWKATSKTGCSVYNFRLLRVINQEQLGSHFLKLADQLKQCPTENRSGCLHKDISEGKERIHISVYNDFDGEDDPLSFNYLDKPIYPPFVLERSTWENVKRGCRCVSKCSLRCACAKRNGIEVVYDENGILIKGKPLVYECGSFCECPPSCPNRVSQNGVVHRLEVFRSEDRRWTVRSLDPIRAGSFVCEIVGAIVPKEDVPLKCECLIDPGRFPERWMEWGDVSDVFPDYKHPSDPSLLRLSFVLDVSKSRNIGCYLSHSPWPNLFVQPVLYDHYNQSYPHLMVFALENIPPLTELCIDYGIRDEAPRMLTCT